MIMASFRTEFSLHLHYSAGVALLVREEMLPFVPFIGLSILDDVLGEFKLEHIAWHSESEMFLCQATAVRSYWSLTQAKRSLRKAGWTEDPEAKSGPVNPTVK